MNNYCVYAIYKIVDNISFFDSIFYIGISCNLCQRVKEHKSDKINSIKNRIMKKYKWSYKALWQNLSRNEAIEREIFLISFFGRKDLRTGQLSNMTSGGDGGTQPSEEAREKMGDLRSKFPKKERINLINKFIESNLTLEEFAKTIDIKSNTFYGWCKRLKRELITKTITKYPESERKRHAIESCNHSDLKEYAKQNNLSFDTLIDWRHTYKVNCRKTNWSFDIVKKYLKSGLSLRKFSENSIYERHTLSKWIKKYNKYLENNNEVVN